MLALQPVVANPANPVMSHIFLNNTLVLSKYFNKRENIRHQWRNYFKPGYPPLYFCYNFLELAFPLFSGFYTVHGASPLCRSTYETLWEKGVFTFRCNLFTQVPSCRRCQPVPFAGMAETDRLFYSGKCLPQLPLF